MCVEWPHIFWKSLLILKRKKITFFLFLKNLLAQLSLIYIYLFSSALHNLLEFDLNANLTDHDPKRCLVCSPEDGTESVGEQEELMVLSPKSDLQVEQNSIINKFSSLKSAFKTKVIHRIL